MSNYFRQVPDFDYVSRLPDAKISDYLTVKNLFKKGKLADDIFQDLTIFTKYEIEGDDRPDNVADKKYDDPDLDWIILHINNIINVREGWPLTQRDFKNFLFEKYGSIAGYNAAHHYETVEVKDLADNIIIPEGLQVNSDYSITYRDSLSGNEVIASGITTEVTNEAYEEKLQDIKRQIYILRPAYLGIFLDDMERIMTYTHSSQYINSTLVKGDNIKIK